MQESCFVLGSVCKATSSLCARGISKMVVRVLPCQHISLFTTKPFGFPSNLPTLHVLNILAACIIRFGELVKADSTAGNMDNCYLHFHHHKLSLVDVQNQPCWR